MGRGRAGQSSPDSGRKGGRFCADVCGWRMGVVDSLVDIFG